jgi:DNA-binding CsgD family transcriptional regulator
VSAVAFRPKPVHARELVLSVRAALEKAQALRSLSRAQRMISVWTEWLRLVDALLSMPGPTRLPSGVLSGIARRENSPRRSNEPGDWSTPARTLSLREREALFAFTSGLRPRQIAKTLGVTIHTARAHRKAVMTPIPGTPFPCESLMKASRGPRSQAMHQRLRTQARAGRIGRTVGSNSTSTGKPRTGAAHSASPCTPCA